MKAVRIHEFGDEGVLRYEDAPDPTVGPNDVLIRVKAAALNRSDLYRRAGSAGAPPQSLPLIPGLEAAGIVEAVGPQVENRSVGQRVVAFMFPSLGTYAEMGAYAQMAAVPARNT